MVKTEPRSLGRIVGETIFIALTAAALLVWLSLLILAGFFRDVLDRFLFALLV